MGILKMLFLVLMWPTESGWVLNLLLQALGESQGEELESGGQWNQKEKGEDIHPSVKGKPRNPRIPNQRECC